MKALELLISSLDPMMVYRSGEKVAWLVFTYITPVLLVIAVAVRTLETQLDTSASLGKWEKALRDFFLFGFLIGSYFGIMMLFNVLMNEIYLITHEVGNFELLAKQMKHLLAKANQGGGGAFKQALGNATFWMTDPFRWIMSIFYWASNLFMISTHVFLKGGHGIIYSFALVYGLIAIPISITSNFKLLKGWAMLLAATMLWPIVEGLLMGFFGELFRSSAQEVINAGGALSYENDGDFKAFFSVVNVVLAFLMIMAPVIAGYLVANANSMFALVAPFASGALSVGLGAMSAGKNMGMTPLGKGLTAMGAGAGLMSLAPSSNGSGIGGSGATGAGYSGGPSSRGESESGGSPGMASAGSQSSGSASPNPSNPSSSSNSAPSGSGAFSGGVEGAAMESGPTSRSDESDEASRVAKEKKRQKARKGVFANQWRQKNKPVKG